jgi:hypothetical protein
MFGEHMQRKAAWENKHRHLQMRWLQFLARLNYIIPNIHTSCRGYPAAHISKNVCPFLRLSPLETTSGQGASSLILVQYDGSGFWLGCYNKLPRSKRGLETVLRSHQNRIATNQTGTLLVSCCRDVQQYSAKFV